MPDFESNGPRYFPAATSRLLAKSPAVLWLGGPRISELLNKVLLVIIHRDGNGLQRGGNGLCRYKCEPR